MVRSWFDRRHSDNLRIDMGPVMKYRLVGVDRVLSGLPGGMIRYGLPVDHPPGNFVTSHRNSFQEI